MDAMELVRVPKVAEAVTEGTVTRWHVAVGDRVEKDDPLVEMITEKAEGDVYSPAAGRVAAIYAPERSTLPVGYVLCALAGEDEKLPDVEAMNAEILARHQAVLMGEAPPEEPAAAPQSGTGGGHVPEVPEQREGKRYVSPDRAKVPASPAARRLAREKGVDLAEVAARLGLSGPVSAEDVRKFLEETVP